MGCQQCCLWLLTLVADVLGWRPLRAGVLSAAAPVCGHDCAADVQPVCGVDGKSYSNDCVAACAGVAVASKGYCPGASELQATSPAVSAAAGLAWQPPPPAAASTGFTCSPPHSQSQQAYFTANHPRTAPSPRAPAPPRISMCCHPPHRRADPVQRTLQQQQQQQCRRQCPEAPRCHPGTQHSCHSCSCADKVC